jgi:hypothetical protein
MTKLEKPLRREIAIGGHAYIVTLDPLGLKLTPKGKRKGYELTWESLISGDAELAAALRAATAKGPELPERARRSTTRRKPRD